MFRLLIVSLIIDAAFGTGLGGSTSFHSTFGSRSGACYDKDPDCSEDICRNYPYTAKERCPKFCGLCHETGSGSHFSSGSSSSSSHRQSSSSRSRITESMTTKKESESYSLCIDKDLDCSAEICRNYPYTAKERCAKTCGLCHEGTAGSGIGSGHHTAMGTHGSGGAASSSSLRRGSELHSGGLCFDKDLDCTKEICRDYPYTAKERCAKTCGFCGTDTAGSSISSSSSSAIASGAISPSRHASIRTNEPGGMMGSISRHSSIHGRHGTSDNTPAYSSLSKDKELECIDLDNDCTQQTCKNYPYTAKERCARTCGFCRKELTGTGTGSRHSSLTDTHSISSAGSHRSDSSRRGSVSSVGKGECKDQDPKCSEKSCRDHPSTAKTKCAKTCGFCDEGSSHGSIIDLRSPSVDSDDGSVITLDDDGTGTDTGRPSTAMSGRHSTISAGGARTPTHDSRRPSTISRTDSGDTDRPSISMSGRHSTISGGDAGTSTHDSRRPSTIGRTDSIRRPSSASIHTQTTQRPSRVQTRYPGRTGPCADENAYCEKGDCFKYPRFAQRYCEKTCDYC